MKLSLALVSLMAAASSAFVIPSTTSMRSARMQLAASAVRPDASAAIQAALEASKKYGPTSPEARVAWDAVEEMDASDNRYVCFLPAFVCIVVLPLFLVVPCYEVEGRACFINYIDTN